MTHASTSTSTPNLTFTCMDATTLATVLPMTHAIASMRHAFSDHVENPLRIALNSLLFMPARVRQFTGIKVVSTIPGHPLGTVTIYGANGHQIGMIDGRALTLVRTGAAAGLATQVLARGDAHVLVVLGAGAVAPHQIEAVCAVRPITHVLIWSRQAARATALCEIVQKQRRDCKVEVALDANAAVKLADVVCCATPSKSALFDAASIREGTHINAMGAFTPEMVELPAGLLAHARVFVDDVTAAAAEAGDLLQAQRQPDGELRDVLALRMPGRTDAKQITVFKSVGIASQDVASGVAALLGLSALDGE